MNRIEQLNQMLQKSSEDVFLHYALSLEYISAGDSISAIEKLEWLHMNFSNYLPLYYQLGALYISAGEKDKAIAIYEEGIDLALKTKENKTASELRAALDDIMY